MKLPTTNDNQRMLKHTLEGTRNRPAIKVVPSKEEFEGTGVEEHLRSLHKLKEETDSDDESDSGLLSSFRTNDPEPAKFEFTALSQGEGEPIELYATTTGSLSVLEDRLREIYPDTFDISNTLVDIPKKTLRPVEFTVENFIRCLTNGDLLVSPKDLRPENFREGIALHPNSPGVKSEARLGGPTTLIDQIDEDGNSVVDNTTESEDDEETSDASQEPDGSPRFGPPDVDEPSTASNNTRDAEETSADKATSTTNDKTDGSNSPSNDQTDEDTSPSNDQTDGSNSPSNDQTDEDTRPSNDQTDGSDSRTNNQTDANAGSPSEEESLTELLAKPFDEDEDSSQDDADDDNLLTDGSGATAKQLPQTVDQAVTIGQEWIADDYDGGDSVSLVVATEELLPDTQSDPLDEHGVLDIQDIQDDLEKYDPEDFELDNFEDPFVVLPPETIDDGEPLTSIPYPTMTDDGRILARPSLPNTEPYAVRWEGDADQKQDWMTPLATGIHDDTKGSERQFTLSPLSTLFEKLTECQEPTAYQIVFKPKESYELEQAERIEEIEEGGTGGIIDQAVDNLLGDIEIEDVNTDDEVPERIPLIDEKPPDCTFEVNARAISVATGAHIGIGPAYQHKNKEQTEAIIDDLQSLTSLLDPLDGDFYKIEGEFLDVRDERLATSVAFYNRKINTSDNESSLFSVFPDKHWPELVLSPIELASLILVPPTSYLSSEGKRGAQSSQVEQEPLPRPEPELLNQFKGTDGLELGYALDENRQPGHDPITLPTNKLTEHYLRAASTGHGKSIGIINDLLSLRRNTNGPNILIDPKGGRMCYNYLRCHYAEFDRFTDVYFFRVPEDLPAISFFDIRPQLAAGQNRKVAVQDKIEHFHDIGRMIMGYGEYNRATVALEVLTFLIKALFDPKYGKDAITIGEIREAVQNYHEMGKIPQVCKENRNIEKVLADRYKGSEQESFDGTMTAVKNRLDKIAEYDHLHTIFSTVPDWDEEKEEYTEPAFHFKEIIEDDVTILFDIGDLRSGAQDAFAVLLLSNLWDSIRQRGRDPEDPPGTINLILEEAASVAGTTLVYEDLLPQGRGFGLSMGLVMQFPQQVNYGGDAGRRAYNEVLNNIKTKLIGNIQIEEKLSRALAHEKLDAQEIQNRIGYLPSGEWVIDLPGSEFGGLPPHPFSLGAAPIPDGHPDGPNPLSSAKEDHFISEHGILDSVQSLTRSSYTVGAILEERSEDDDETDGESGEPDDNPWEDEEGDEDDSGDSESSEAETVPGSSLGTVSADEPTANDEDTQQTAGVNGYDPSELKLTSKADVQAEARNIGAEEIDDYVQMKMVADLSTYANEELGLEIDSNKLLTLATEKGSDSPEQSGSGPDGSQLESMSDFSPEDTPSDDTQQSPDDTSSQSEPLSQTTNAGGDIHIGSEDFGNDTPESSPGDIAEAEAGAGTPNGTLPDGMDASEQDATEDAVTDSESDQSRPGESDTQPVEITTENTAENAGDDEQDNSKLEDEVKYRVVAGNVPQEKLDRMDITRDEARFLGLVLDAMNRNLEEYDLLDSMAPLLEFVEGVDVEKLEDKLLLETHGLHDNQKYFTCTPAGRELLNATRDVGDGKGDVGEKTPHIVGVELLARYLEQFDGVDRVKRYHRVDDDITFDVAAFNDGKLTHVGEVELGSNNKEAPRKDYEKLAEADAKAVWAVNSKSEAKTLFDIFTDEGVIEEPLNTTETKTYSNMRDALAERDLPGMHAVWSYNELNRKVNR